MCGHRDVIDNVYKAMHRKSMYVRNNVHYEQ